MSGADDPWIGSRGRAFSHATASSAAFCAKQEIEGVSQWRQRELTDRGEDLLVQSVRRVVNILALPFSPQTSIKVSWNLFSVASSQQYHIAPHSFFPCRDMGDLDDDSFDLLEDRLCQSSTTQRDQHD
ncbi:hypothetical protein AK812_SmicGene15639 [Symbiodinium microadriaticum]|uniref:Uncharacterized protein n=1 Tax=Symbiodinium microadriaticum TaxID=2951 RepID=A0A1Q9E2I2_SYMMI|nr:hypothetical protein AK812_SmicGene15639 [Symbiodinium microadriaticum]